MVLYTIGNLSYPRAMDDLYAPFELLSRRHRDLFDLIDQPTEFWEYLYTVRMSQRLGRVGYYRTYHYRTYHFMKDRYPSMIFVQSYNTLSAAIAGHSSCQLRLWGY